MTENRAHTASENNATQGGVSIRIIGAIAIVVAILLAFFAFSLAGYITDLKDRAADEEFRYVECNGAIDDLQVASDYLTTQVRLFVATGRQEYMKAYLDELNITNRRVSAVEALRRSISDDEAALSELEHALETSDELTETELAAMRLACDYYQVEDMPDKVANVSLKTSVDGLSQEEKLEMAQRLVFDASYDEMKEDIQARVTASSNALLSQLDAKIAESDMLMQNLLFQLRISVALLLCVVMMLVLVVFMYVFKPLNRSIRRIEKNEPLVPDGAAELRYLAQAYNVMYEDNSKRIEQLREYAERDALTGISNRNGYKAFLAKHTRNVALLLIDVDNFSEFNDVYGRDIGNAVLVKLAKALCTAFRSTDFPCRVESDEFAVIMTNVNEGMRDTITHKVGLVNSILADDSDELPLITLSVGVAFSAEGRGDQEIYQAANEALIQVQEHGMNGIAFYGESGVL